ncbi:sulfite exporter TauE/SafE family protein [Roseicyclus sp.]|uniref:sulfite exporter TauE/SafE family protein n=1 Tax=Roseicyclus sp. TaxID=1914329 RepID=UPI003F6CA89D
MLEGLAAALSLPALPWLCAGALVSGAVYGFAGFGAALVFMPISVALVPPAMAVAAFALTALIALVTVVPRAWAATDKPGLGQMLLGTMLGFPLGIWALRVWDGASIRLVVSVVVLATLAVLIAGWRMAPRPRPAARLLVGATTGLIGGATGVTGPVVILFNLGAGAPAQVTRANTLVFLTLCSGLLLGHLWLQGLLSPAAIWLGVVLMLPYALGNWIGQAIFDPAAESLYRRVAYGIIAVAALVGLPIWT